jgi:hypothetical protein
MERTKAELKEKLDALEAELKTHQNMLASRMSVEIAIFTLGFALGLLAGRYWVIQQ